MTHSTCLDASTWTPLLKLSSIQFPIQFDPTGIKGKLPESDGGLAWGWAGEGSAGYLCYFTGSKDTQVLNVWRIDMAHEADQLFTASHLTREKVTRAWDWYKW